MTIKDLMDFSDPAILAVWVITLLLIGGNGYFLLHAMLVVLRDKRRARIYTRFFAHGEW